MTQVLAIEGGATRTRAALYDGAGRIFREASGGPANPVAYGLPATVASLTAIARELIPAAPDDPVCICAGVSGAGQAEFGAYLARQLLLRLPAQRVILTNDALPILRANSGTGAGVLAVAGTGSSVVAQTASSMTRVFGGRGAVLGESGSGYGLGLDFIRAALDRWEDSGDSTWLDAVLGATGLESAEALPRWIESARKCEIADISRRIWPLLARNSSELRELVARHADALARTTADAAAWAGSGEPVDILYYGGLFREVSDYEAQFRRALDERRPGLRPRFPEVSGCDALAAFAADTSLHEGACVLERSALGRDPDTELRLNSAPPLDALDARGIVGLMNEADHRAADAVLAAGPEIAALMERVAEAFREGGRLIYAGAGTSGRLGVLDASECPPTFGVSPDDVVGIMAGGVPALRDSVEGVEDDAESGATAIAALSPGVCPKDVVAGITASGTTPFAVGALERAKSLGACTALVCCNAPDRQRFDYVVLLDTGPEVLPGSTRLKAGTATKMALNQISTGAMALSGRVYKGFMIGVRPQNAKLRRRAVGIVAALTRLDEPGAAALLDSAGGAIPVAVVMAKRGCSRIEAESELAAHGGLLREVLGD